MNAKTGRVVRRVLVTVAGVVGVAGAGAAGASATESGPVPPIDQSVVTPHDQPGPAGFAKPDWYEPGVYYFGGPAPLGDGQ